MKTKLKKKAKIPQALKDVWEWKDEIYNEVKSDNVEEMLKKIIIMSKKVK